jgi:hypothetical protein
MANVMEEKTLIKTRHLARFGKTVYYYSDGTKKTEYWESIDTFCANDGI